uniref:CRF domain-containing protein n=1 Tax=Strongyloides papillosus TaxID=174720 RepID=A0A0N5CCD9_STREA
MKTYELKSISKMYYIEYFTILALLTVQCSFQDFSSSSSEEKQVNNGFPREPTIYKSSVSLAPESARGNLIRELTYRLLEEKEKVDKLIEEAKESLGDYYFLLDELRINNEEINKNKSPFGNSRSTLEGQEKIDLE